MHPSHKKLQSLVKSERKILCEILTHLRVINDKKIFTQMGYKSLMHYCVKELGYSESAAYRRISALRLEKKIPNARKQIASGEINLSTASKLNNLLDFAANDRGGKVSEEIKNDIVASIKNKSTAESEELIRKKLEIPPKKRRVNIEMSEESYQKWIEFKGNHIAKRMTDEALLMFALEKAQEIKEVRKYRKASPQESKNPRYIQAAVKRLVMQNAGHRCQHKGCNSTFGLEIDHKVPVSRGGKGNIENLQVLCRHHNGLKSNL